MEIRVPKRLLSMFKSKQLFKLVYDDFRPTQFQHLRLYGLPNIYMKGILSSTDFSMVASVQHELAKWLSQILQTIPDLYSTACIPDWFWF